VEHFRFSNRISFLVRLFSQIPLIWAICRWKFATAVQSFQGGTLAQADQKVQESLEDLLYLHKNNALARKCRIITDAAPPDVLGARCIIPSPSIEPSLPQRALQLPLILDGHADPLQMHHWRVVEQSDARRITEALHLVPVLEWGV